MSAFLRLTWRTNASPGQSVAFTCNNQSPYASAFSSVTVVTTAVCLYCAFAATLLGRSFVKRLALCYPTVVCPVLSVCDIDVLWPNGWMDQDATWYGGRPRPHRHCVRFELSSAPTRGTPASPIFGSCLLWPNGRSSQLLLSSCHCRHIR